MRWLFDDDVDALRNAVHASAWTDEETSNCIRDTWNRHGKVIDPHTAVGLLGMRAFRARNPGTSGVVLSTAHPAKFAETVEPLVGHDVPLPANLARRLKGDRNVVAIGPGFNALEELLRRL